MPGSPRLLLGFWRSDRTDQVAEAGHGVGAFLGLGAFLLDLGGDDDTVFVEGGCREGVAGAVGGDEVRLFDLAERGRDHLDARHQVLTEAVGAFGGVPEGELAAVFAGAVPLDVGIELFELDVAPVEAIAAERHAVEHVGDPQLLEEGAKAFFGRHGCLDERFALLVLPIPSLVLLGEFFDDGVGRELALLHEPGQLIHRDIDVVVTDDGEHGIEFFVGGNQSQDLGPECFEPSRIVELGSQLVDVPLITLVHTFVGRVPAGTQGAVLDLRDVLQQLHGSPRLDEHVWHDQAPEGSTRPIKVDTEETYAKR